jgi:hypothetical protein
VWWVGKNSPSEFCDCFLCFQTCACSCTVILKKDFSSIFVGLDSREMLLQGFKSVNVQIWVNSVTKWYNV